MQLIKIKIMRKSTIMMLFIAAISFMSACKNSAQEAVKEKRKDEMTNKENRVSPQATATATIGTNTITVNYSSPAVKGRQIWGALVPYGEVWRTGANEATTVTFTQDVTIQGQTLSAANFFFKKAKGTHSSRKRILRDYFWGNAILPQLNGNIFLKNHFKLMVSSSCYNHQVKGVSAAVNNGYVHKCVITMSGYWGYKNSEISFQIYTKQYMFYYLFVNNEPMFLNSFLRRLK